LCPYNIDDNHLGTITIGNNTAIGLRTTIFGHFYVGPNRSDDHAKPVIIEEDVFFGPHCVVVKPDATGIFTDDIVWVSALVLSGVKYPSIPTTRP
jgi:hypothetical protein